MPDDQCRAQLDCGCSLAACHMSRAMTQHSRLDVQIDLSKLELLNELKLQAKCFVTSLCLLPLVER
eukprot:2195455-Amphidinium_carterae.1